MDISSVRMPQASQALQQSPLPALRRLSVEETDCEVIIVGSVCTYYLKQLAQEAVCPALDGRRLRNHVIVTHS